jgi:hypothetical protein
MGSGVYKAMRTGARLLYFFATHRLVSCSIGPKVLLPGLAVAANIGQCPSPLFRLAGYRRRGDVDIRGGIQALQGERVKKLTLVLLLLSSAAWAKGKAQGPPCAVKFSVVQKDTLGNVQQGVQGKALKWLETDLEKKYPDVCYATPDQVVTALFYIAVEPATYHGTRIVDTSSTTNGNVMDNEGDSATYQGTTNSSTVVPETFEYGKFTLTLETMSPDRKAIARHRFQQDGIYRTLYGIPLGGRGHHPQQALIEDAVKWIHEGGLEDPLQTLQ